MDCHGPFDHGFMVSTLVCEMSSLCFEPRLGSYHCVLELNRTPLLDASELMKDHNIISTAEKVMKTSMFIKVML